VHTLHRINTHEKANNEIQKKGKITTITRDTANDTKKLVSIITCVTARACDGIAIHSR